ncbi:unnamed protein product [Spirodela intermedia]|uniref:Uncharacterized protein n=1 Tax=Spirodela intermedia TaxID=51605 RepID=A0A7I8IMF7_SPIIN|nr:unnamed protein product [Spirodela intermedia]CAA6659026.1 unnamed protein product [Spirodela intermedia]
MDVYSTFNLPNLLRHGRPLFVCVRHVVLLHPGFHCRSQKSKSEPRQEELITS